MNHPPMVRTVATKLLREMGAPGLSLGQRKGIGTHMLIRIAMMGVIALIVFITRH